MHIILFKNRRLKKAEHALNHGKYKEALRLGRPLVNSRNNEIAFLTNRLCGLALYKQKKFDDSIKYLEKACQLGNYRHDWYNLTMTLAFADKVEEAEKAFQNIYRTNVQPGYMYAVPVPGLLFQYMKALKQNQFTDSAKLRANELLQMYAGVGNDITKQVQRGLPSFPIFLKEVESLLPSEKINTLKKEFDS